MKTKKIMVLFFMIIVVLSCNKHDETTVKDGDNLLETEIQAEEENFIEEEIQTEKNDLQIETEQTNDEDADLETVQRPEECPKLKYAKFPYYREDGTITFCRKCDLPADSKDPDCVKNLWKNANARYVEDHPKDDCLGYPCYLDTVKHIESTDKYGYFLTKCDIRINPPFFSTSSRNNRIARISEGKLGLSIYKFDDWKYSEDRGFEYDIKTGRYKVIMPTTYASFTYYKGNALSSVYDYEKVVDMDSFRKAKYYLIYYDKEKGYKVAFNAPIYDFVNDSVITMNDKWAFIVIEQENKNYGTHPVRMYAKIGEWKWHHIGDKYEENSLVSLSGDKMTIYNDKYPLKGYICDLSKYPEKYSDCELINRKEDKNIWEPAFDKKDGNRLAYSSYRDGKAIFTVLEFKNGKKIYTDYEIPKHKYATDVQINEFVGDIIFYDELLDYGPDFQGSPYDGRFCFYNIKEKKAFCFKKDFPSREYYYQYYGDFDGRYVTWENGAILRDMKCYCELEPSLCPIPEYRPKN